MAFKTFNAGDVLPASDVNTYLMKQAVIVCTSGTRPSSPVEGMTIYETDTDIHRVYNGASWVLLLGLTLGAYKTADTSRSSTTTLTADPHLTLSVAANAVYAVHVSLAYQAGTTEDMKTDFTVPSGATMDTTRYLNNIGTHQTIATAATVGIWQGSGGNEGATMWGTLVTSSAGTFALRWAQNTSGATATILRAMSSMTLQRIA